MGAVNAWELPEWLRVYVCVLSHGSWMTEDRVEDHLYYWKCWMYGGKTGHLKYRNKASGGFADAHTDSESLVAIADTRCAEATDAAINDLHPTERQAIHAQRLETLWPLPERALPLYYRVAVTAVGRGLDKRGIV